MQITVEEFKTYIHNVRMHTPGIYNCCNAWVFNSSYHFDNGYEVAVTITILDGNLIVFEKELRQFFNNALDAYAFAISIANKAVL